MFISVLNLAKILLFLHFLLLFPRNTQLLPIFAPLFSVNLSLTTNQNQANQNHSIVYYHNRRSTRSTVNSSDYDNFLSGLEAMDAIRKDKFFRLNSHYKHNKDEKPALNSPSVIPQRPSSMPPGQHRMLLNVNGTAVTPGVGPFQYRKFNFSTGIQFEEEFDCDLNLLSKCESSLLTKIELIEDRHEVFTTVDDRVASQEDILEICHSIDVEFKCLFDYAQKCEHKMSYSTFTILRYIITTNNETIVSCRNKELDWLDINSFDSIHELNKNNKTGPCIPEREVYQCFVDSFGYDFDPNRDVVETDSQCQAAHNYEKCIKHCIYEASDPANSNCQVEQKEKSLELLLSMIRFNVPASVSENPTHPSSLYCKKLSLYWSKKYSNNLNELERTGSDEGPASLTDLTDHIPVQDQASKLTNMLRHSYIALLPNHCSAKMDNVQELCYSRYEQRLRKLWDELKLSYSKVNYISNVDETEMMCCASSELTECISVFVLIRCGREQFVTFHEKVEFNRASSLPDQCLHHTYKTHKCQSLLKS